MAAYFHKRLVLRILLVTLFTSGLYAERDQSVEHKVTIGPLEPVSPPSIIPGGCMDSTLATLRRDEKTWFFYHSVHWGTVNEKYIGNANNPFQVRVWSKTRDQMYDLNGWYQDVYHAGIWLHNIYKMDDGNLLGVAHVELHYQEPGVGQGEDYVIGLVYSTDRGNSWTYCGEIVRPWNRKCNVGGTPLLVVGDYFYVYFNEYGPGDYYAISTVARARIDEVLTAARLHTVTQWVKYNDGSWTQPGLTGIGSAVLPPFQDLHADGAYNRAAGLYMITSNTSKDGVGRLYLNTSKDGVHFDKRYLLDEVMGGGHPYSTILASPEDQGTNDMSTVGHEFYVLIDRKGANYCDDVLYRRKISIVREDLQGVPAIDNLYLWMDADELLYLGLAAGDRIVEWPDRGPRQTHLETISATFPKYVPSALNGHPAAYWDPGTYSQWNDAPTMQTSGVANELYGNPDFTIFLVARIPQPASQSYSHPVCWGSGNASGKGSAIELEHTDSKLDWATGWGADATTPASSFSSYWNEWAIISLRKSAGPINTAKISINGVPQSVSGSTILPNIAAPPGQSPRLYMGTANGFMAPPEMWVSEWIVYDRDLDDNEEAAIGTYLAEKYGLATAYDYQLEHCFLTIDASLPSQMTAVNPGPGTYRMIKDQKVPLQASPVYVEDCPAPENSFDHWQGDVHNPNAAVTWVLLNMDKTITCVFSDARRCGDMCHPYPKSDFTKDCKVDLADLARLSAAWLVDNSPR